MKVTVLSFNAVAAWKWNASTEPHQLYSYAKRGPTGQIEVGDDEDDDEVCGICQSAFESTCPDCKVPGDDCPLSTRQCGAKTDPQFGANARISFTCTAC